jgi:hypothetical protein
MEQLIKRLGFGAYAENIIVNYIEDWRKVILTSHKGNHTIEKEDYTMNASWEDKSLSISIRAYVEGDGWQTLEQTITILDARG